MADTISFLTFPNEAKLSSCVLLEPSIDGSIYLPLKLFDIKDKEVKHSKPLLRIIREAIYKKKELPLSCQNLIDANRDNFNFEPCTLSNP